MGSFVENRHGKGPLYGSRFSREDDIKMNLREIRYDAVFGVRRIC